MPGLILDKYYLYTLYSYIGNLKAAKRFSEAARVWLDYARDVEEGVVTLLEGGCWEEALRVVHLHSRQDLLDSHVTPSVMEAAASQLALFEALETRFVKQATRLEVVRRAKKEKEKAILGTRLHSSVVL